MIPVIWFHYWRLRNYKDKKEQQCKRKRIYNGVEPTCPVKQFSLIFFTRNHRTRWGKIYIYLVIFDHLLMLSFFTSFFVVSISCYNMNKHYTFRRSYTEWLHNTICMIWLTWTYCEIVTTFCIKICMMQF